MDGEAFFYGAGRGKAKNLRGGEHTAYISWTHIQQNLICIALSEREVSQIYSTGWRYFHFLFSLNDNQKNWIAKDVKDGVSCISYWQAGLGIVQCSNIIPSFLYCKNMRMGSFFACNFRAVLIIFMERGGASIPVRKYYYKTSKKWQWFWEVPVQDS